MIISRKSLRSLILEEIDNSLPGCKHKKISVDSIPITVEIADNDFLRNRGLMFRDSIPENEGMLFIFPESTQLGFWMKNTNMPLSIAFIDENHMITNVEDLDPLNLNTIFSNQSAKFALEMNRGWFKKNLISSGKYVSL